MSYTALTRSYPTVNTYPTRRVGNRLARLLILAILLQLLGAPGARAQIPGLPGLGGLFGGAVVVFDPTAVGKLVEQIRSQLQQVAMQEQQLAAQLQALEKLGNPNWRSIDQALVQMDGVMQRGEALAYSLDALDAAFAATFPGPEVYHDFAHEEPVQASRTLATLRGVLNAAHRAAQEFPTGTGTLEAMKTQLAAVPGHEAALELNATAAIYSAEELMLLRQAVLAGSNAQAVYAAHEIDQAAQAHATVRANLTALAQPSPPVTPYSLAVDP